MVPPVKSRFNAILALTAEAVKRNHTVAFYGFEGTRSWVPAALLGSPNFVYHGLTETAVANNATRFKLLLEEYTRLSVQGGISNFFKAEKVKVQFLKSGMADLSGNFTEGACGSDPAGRADVAVLDWTVYTGEQRPPCSKTCTHTHTHTHTQTHAGGHGHSTGMQKTNGAGDTGHTGLRVANHALQSLFPFASGMPQQVVAEPHSMVVLTGRLYRLCAAATTDPQRNCRAAGMQKCQAAGVLVAMPNAQVISNVVAVRAHVTESTLVTQALASGLDWETLRSFSLAGTVARLKNAAALMLVEWGAYPMMMGFLRHGIFFPMTIPEIDGPREVGPLVRYVGPFIDESRQLPDLELDDWISAQAGGVVLVSMGTILSGEKHIAAVAAAVLRIADGDAAVTVLWAAQPHQQQDIPADLAPKLEAHPRVRVQVRWWPGASCCIVLLAGRLGGWWLCGAAVALLLVGLRGWW